MAAGPKYHLHAQQRLERAAAENGGAAPVITSAGALVDGIRTLQAHRIALIAPYMQPLTRVVISYLNDFEIEVVDSISLEVGDNLKVGRLDPLQLLDIAHGLDLRRADALVLSACVQMPSLPAIQAAEDRFGLPVLSAATATTYQLLRTLGLAPAISGAGALLADVSPTRHGVVFA
jgi:maleate isomerase